MPTLEQVFQREKAWIAECDDVDALIEKIGDWRDSLRVAEREGDQLVRMRAGDLVKLARARVVWLQAGAIREESDRSAAVMRPAAPPTSPASRPAEIQRPSAEDRPGERRADDGASRREQERRDAERRAKTEAALADAARAKAAARLAEAAAARVEAQMALLRAQAEAARRVAVPEARTMTAAKSPGPEPPAAPKPFAAGIPAPTITTAPRPATPSRVSAAESNQAAPPDDVYTDADRLALASVGHWPPTPFGHRGAFWTKHDDWPRDWTLTGGDLGRFHGEVNLTRAVFAAQLGVPSALVKDAELSPRERVGPALQIALRRVIDHAAEVRRRRREGRATAQAAPASAAAELLSASPPVVIVQGATDAPRAFTGADLVRLRGERALSQRELAVLLGVGHGMVGKAELVPSKPLGEGMAAAFARVALPGGATG